MTFLRTVGDEENVKGKVLKGYRGSKGTNPLILNI
jgi:hypothetical protein